jgi:hypothetical protein
MRAFHIDAVGTPPKATCPLCGKSFVAKGFFAHVTAKHSEQVIFLGGTDTATSATE